MNTALRTYDRSRALHERAQASLAGGVSSGFRKNQRPTPLYFREGHGSRLVDVDGNEVIDYTLAYGPQILGHSHPAVVQAVQQQVARGQTFGAQNELEPRLAEKLVRLLPACERITFSTTGSEAVQVALRLARAHTGRSMIIRFAGHYHGWMDNILAKPAVDGTLLAEPVSAGQSRSALGDVLCLTWNDLAAVERALEAHSGQVAGIILEPLLANGGGFMPAAGYLEGLRKLCTRHGVLLIFDEVITGFRVALGGASQLFGVIPDLAVFGKAVAGGFPLSVVGGRAEVMDLIAEQKVFHAGTLNGNPVALAAALATIEELERDDGQMLRRVRSHGEQLQAGIRDACAAYGQPVRIHGVGSVFWTYFTATPIDDHRAFCAHDGRAYASFTERLLDQGVLVMASGRWYVSGAHDGTDLEQTLAAFRAALALR